MRPAIRIVLLGLSCLLEAQTPDGVRMKADVTLLASRAFEGRGTGTPGQMKAAHRVADRFRELGLQPLGQGPEPFFLPFTLDHLTASLEGSTLALNGSRLPLGPGVTTTLLEPVQVPLTYLPLGLQPDASLGGHWIASFAPAGKTAGAVTQLYMKFRDQGVAGLLLLPDPKTDGLKEIREANLMFQARGRWTLEGQKSAPTTAMATLDPSAAQGLGLDLAALAERTTPMPLGTLSVSPKSSTDRISTVNVAGLLPGSDPALKGEVVVLSAHEDHLGISGGRLYPGADDNASGTSVLLETARLLKDARPRRSILFLSVSGEELGLFGSKAFVAHPPVPLSSIVADLNTDMVGRNDPRTLSVTPARIEGATGTLTRDARSLSAELHLTLTDEADRYWKRSDHYTFAQAGIPSLFLFGGMEPDYHSPTDTADKVDPLKLVNVAELLRRLALSTANGEAKPKVLPSSEWESWTWATP